MGATYERLGIPRLESLVGAGVFYGGGVTEAQAMEGQQVYVVGAGNSAGQAAVHLAQHAARVTMLVRGSDLAASMSDYLVRTIEATKNIDVLVRTTVVDGHGAGKLEELVYRTAVAGRPGAFPPRRCSSSLVHARTPTGCPRRFNGTSTASSSPAQICDPRMAQPQCQGDRRCCWRAACRECSLPVTCAMAR